MLKIRLARGGKKKAAFYRVVLTEHTKPVKSGYKTILGWFDPVKHEIKLDIDLIKEWIGKGAQPSNRVAKLALKESGDAFFERYIERTDRVRKKKNAPDEPEEEAQSAAPVADETPKASEAVVEAPAETPVEEKTEAPSEDAPAAEEKTDEAAAPAEEEKPDEAKEEKTTEPEEEIKQDTSEE